MANGAFQVNIGCLKNVLQACRETDTLDVENSVKFSSFKANICIPFIKILLPSIVSDDRTL